MKLNIIRLKNLRKYNLKTGFILNEKDWPFDHWAYDFYKHVLFLLKNNEGNLLTVIYWIKNKDIKGNKIEYYYNEIEEEKYIDMKLIKKYKLNNKYSWLINELNEILWIKN